MSSTMPDAGLTPVMRWMTSPTSSAESAQLDATGRPSKALDETRSRLDLEQAVRDQQQQPHAAQLAGEERQELERRRVGPVQVVEDDHQRRAIRDPAQEGRHRVE
jgi:hypothetical protein